MFLQEGVEADPDEDDPGNEEEDVEQVEAELELRQGAAPAVTSILHHHVVGIWLVVEVLWFPVCTTLG